jgi:hypothetical protein
MFGDGIDSTIQAETERVRHKAESNKLKCSNRTLRRQEIV